jgi:hypothetical protein
MQVDVVTSALPSGASTDAKLDEVKALIGEVTTTPTNNTVLDRLKDLLTGTILAAGDNNVGNVDVVTSALPTGAATEATLAAVDTKLNVVDDWDETDRCKVNIIAGQVGVQGGSGALSALTQRVVLATDQPAIPTISTVSTVTAVTTVTTLTGGGIAHDAADSGNPIKVGAKAFSPDGTTPGTAVAEGDRSDLKADLDGRLFVNSQHPRASSVHFDGSSAYTDQSIASAPGAGFQTVITNIICSKDAATAMNFFLEEGSTKVFGPIYLEAVAGRGFASGPINKRITANTAVTFTSSAAIAQSFEFEYITQAI